MKKQVITMLVVFSALPLTSSAELSWGTERDNCFRQEKTIPLAYDCLAKKKDESNRKLDVLISETDKRINGLRRTILAHLMAKRMLKKPQAMFTVRGFWKHRGNGSSTDRSCVLRLPLRLMKMPMIISPGVISAR